MTVFLDRDTLGEPYIRCSDYGLTCENSGKEAERSFELIYDGVS